MPTNFVRSALLQRVLIKNTYSFLYPSRRVARTARCPFSMNYIVNNKGQRDRGQMTHLKLGKISFFHHYKVEFCDKNGQNPQFSVRCLSGPDECIHQISATLHFSYLMALHFSYSSQFSYPINFTNNLEFLFCTKQFGSNPVYGSNQGLWIQSRFMGPIKSLWVKSRFMGPIKILAQKVSVY